MRQTVSSVSFIIAIALVGCAESHGSGEDSGPIVTSCAGDSGPAPFFCVQGSGHICGDAFMAPGCVDGAWQCPVSWTPEPLADCWCSGRAPLGCECTALGWSCDHDGGPIDSGPTFVDAGTECPADPSSAEGTPCAVDGASCGRCTDSCGWCNILSCIGGVWTRLEAFPPPDPCTSFDCGPELRCQAETQYCARELSDVSTVPDGYRCAPLPSGCTSCECSPVPEACEQGPEGGMTITTGGA